MSVQAITWALKQDLPSSPKFVLVALCNYADQDGRCWPGQKALASDTSMSDRSIRTHLKELERRGIIVREQRRRSDGSRTSDYYVINRKSFPLEEDQPENIAQPTGKSCQNQPENLSGHEPSRLEPSKEPSVVYAHAPGFDAFWQAYPRKVGKGAARKAWGAAIKRAPPDEIIAGLEKQLAWFAQQYHGPGEDYRPHAATWLRADRWGDEIDQPFNAEQAVYAALDEKWRREGTEDENEMPKLR